MNRDKKINCNNNPNIGFLHYRHVNDEPSMIDQHNAYIGYFLHSEEKSSLLTMLLTQDSIKNPHIIMRNIGIDENSNETKQDEEEDYILLEEDETRKITDTWELIEMEINEETKRKTDIFRDTG